MDLTYLQRIFHPEEIPRWQLREEAESLLPKVNSWRDTGDTTGRKNHQEEAKLLHLYTRPPPQSIPMPC
jgi:hypothetical protein